jgi:hypothetical protein
VKLRQDQKDKFIPPFDVYLNYLVCVGVCQPIFSHQPKDSKSWTIWLYPEEFQQFLLLKEASGHSTSSHASFVDVLLQSVDQLLRLHMIPSFQSFRSSQKRNSFRFNDIVKSTSKRARHNLKLPLQLKDMFQQPFEEDLQKMIEIGNGLVSIPFSEVEWNLLLKECPKGSDWTIWLSESIWTLFQSLKSKWAPGLKHAEFVYLLLRIRERVNE